MKKFGLLTMALSAILFASTKTEQSTTNTKDSNATEEAIAATKNAASKISILIGEKAHELKEAATPLAKDAMEKAGELKEKATPMLEQAIEKAKELKEKLINGDNAEDNTSK